MRRGFLKGIACGLAAALIGGAAYAWQISEPPDMETVTYVATVEAGDTIWDLAGRLALPEDDIRCIAQRIREQNGIRDARDLQPGQTLVVTVERAK